jgi:hypothetical protein
MLSVEELQRPLLSEERLVWVGLRHPAVIDHRPLVVDRLRCRIAASGVPQVDGGAASPKPDIQSPCAIADNCVIKALS